MRRILLPCLLGVGLLTGSAQAEEAKPKPTWTDTLTLKGDLRYRIENIEEEGKEDRYRHRIRARVGAEAKPGEDLTIGLQFSTSENNDPVSGNQSLGNGASRKDIFLDLAYLDWHPATISGLHVIGGKMENPFLRVSDLVWDSDLNPEGLAIKHTLGGDGLDLRLSAGSFWVEERSATSDDAMLYGAQAVGSFKKDDLNILIGAGYFLFENLEGFPVIDVTGSDRAKARAFGNDSIKETELVDGVETTTDVLYGTGFEIAELIAEVGFNVGVPAAVFGNYAVNQDADEDDTAYLVGFRLGKTKEPGSFDFAYNYREIEANAVLGAWTDADYIGGGTDGKSHKFSLGYQLTKLLKGQLTYFMSEKGLNGAGTDYDRVQVDVSAKF
ncbi:MAG TPA: putative porin [Kiritimatiellia bacterium]|nr:putative porin [Kiritimatiellia bacterium]